MYVHSTNGRFAKPEHTCTPMGHTSSTNGERTHGTTAPEPKKESSTEKKRKEDMQFCSRVLEIPLTDIEVCWRAGKVDESKPEYCRPLIIKLKDEELVKEWTKDGVPTLERGDGSRTSGPADSAEVLAEAFSSVFVHEPENLPDVEMPEGNCDILNDIDISFDKVKHELETLNCFKSYGPDNIHPKLLQSLADDSSFVDAVVELFRECTDSGKLPEIWKSANLSALFKSGSKTDPLNYRPVSLTCILCKIYEKILRNEILAFVEDKISPQQHGFVKGKSCLSNLLETMDCILELLEEGIPVDILYFDFKKAFDRVPHNRLILKLQGLGIEGKVLDVIKDFLIGRNFRVSVNGQFSSFKKILSGIPQGSVIGPLLFILFINDLPECLKSTVKIFADDLKLIANLF
ncbi:hypothetical protein ACHWQZ_G019213 [Mnemiopsis leidyi]